MRVSAICVLVCACALAAAGDVAQLKTAKARLLGKLARHHKRGVLSAVPPYKLGHDIPHVHHSVIKPLLVTYPPTAVPVSVKVPLTNPLVHRWPVPAGHRFPVPHPHFGLKFPHKTFGVTKPDNHFHHHHHHIARPAVPVVPATPVVPVAQPSIPVAHPVPAPPPVFVHPAPAPPALPAPPLPVSPPPVHVFPPHFHVQPALPPPAPVAVQPPVFPAPQYPAYAPQLNYVIRPGNAVQTSYFATYPRYPLVNYQTPIVPVAQPSPIIPVAAPAAPGGQVFLERPAQLPHYHLLQQAADHSHGLVEHHAHGSPQVQPTPPLLHAAPLEPHPAALLPTPPSVHVDHYGWSPVQPTPQDLAGHHYLQEHHQLAHEQHQVTQEQVPQVYEHHDQLDQHDQYHELQLQLQQQLQHAQHEQHARDQQLAQEYGQPQQDFHHQQDYHHQQQDFHHQQQEFHQQQQDFHQQQEYQVQQEYAQPSQEYGVPQQQLELEYGAPQHSGQQQQGGFEGRSSEGEAEGEEQQFHNHIPLRLQPPLDRPLEHFR